jgi:cold shock CspA family protein
VIGHVKYLKRGLDGGLYGHIVPEGKKVDDKTSQVFFHETDLEAGSRIPEKGAEVEYELVPHCPWLRALWMRPISKRSYAPVQELRKAAVNGD